MPRVILKPYEFYPVRSNVVVRVDDLNYGAHLGYDRLLTQAHDVRLRLFKHLQVTELDLGDGKIGIVAADAAISYRGEAFLHDPLIFETFPAEIGAGSFRLAHRVTNETTGKLVALIEIGFAAFDFEKRGPTRLPLSFKNAMEVLTSADYRAKPLTI